MFKNEIIIEFEKKKKLNEINICVYKLGSIVHLLMDWWFWSFVSMIRSSEIFSLSIVGADFHSGQIPLKNYYVFFKPFIDLNCEMENQNNSPNSLL